MPRTRASSRFPNWLRPTLADLFLASLVGWLFVTGQSWTALLADADTGWHIRTGEWILQTRSVPTQDLFSFTRAGQPWCAWEWLSDVIFALLARPWGLAGVTVFAGIVIALSAVVLLRHMVGRGSHALVALLLTLLVAGASSMHYLARPHIFTLLLFAVSLMMIERDRRRPGRALWLLVPLSAVWVNLHGGFFALPATLAALTAGCAGEAWLDPARGPEKWRPCRRYAALGGGALAASLVNPYGIGLHRHIAAYLSSDWIRNSVDEFASPRFRSESSLQFEFLLVAAFLLAGWLIARKRLAEAFPILLWGHLSLMSARHVPLFAIAAAPLLAAEVSRFWRERAATRPAQSPIRILCSVGADLAPGFARLSPWAAPLLAGVILLTPAARWPRDFPESMFPVTLVRGEAARLSAARVFTSDQWGDYLIYHGWPRQRVFIDGRSDFCGPALGNDYLRLVAGRPGWDQLLNKYEIGVALVPRDWPLAALLDGRPDWQRIGEDKLSVLYQRIAGANAGAVLRRY